MYNTYLHGVKDDVISRFDFKSFHWQRKGIRAEGEEIKFMKKSNVRHIRIQKDQYAVSFKVVCQGLVVSEGETSPRRRQEHIPGPVIIAQIFPVVHSMDCSNNQFFETESSVLHTCFEAFSISDILTFSLEVAFHTTWSSALPAGRLGAKSDSWRLQMLVCFRGFFHRNIFGQILL